MEYFPSFIVMELRTFRQYPPWAEEPESVWGNNRRIQLRTETGVTPLSNSLKSKHELNILGPIFSVYIYSTKSRVEFLNVKSF